MCATIFMIAASSEKEPRQFPAQKLCIEHAIKFVPKLVAGLAEASQAVPDPFSDDDDATPPSPTF